MAKTGIPEAIEALEKAAKRLLDAAETVKGLRSQESYLSRPRLAKFFKEQV